MATTISGTSGVTFPAGGVGNPAGSVVGTTDSQTLTNKTLGSGLVAGASLITSGTAVASTSGTSVDFTSIPSWVKRITVMFNGVSTSGTSNELIQIGSGSITSSGYASGSILVSTAGANSTNGTTNTAGFVIFASSAANATSGIATLTLIAANTWVSSHAMNTSVGNTICLTGGGNSPALAGALDRVRITTVNGTDTFDAGSINILYE